MVLSIVCLVSIPALTSSLACADTQLNKVGDHLLGKSRAFGLPYVLYVMRTFVIWGRGGLVITTSDSGSRGRGFEPHSGRRLVSLSNTYLPPKRTGNTQETLAPSQHD